jgi:hypothetical protein
MKIELSKAVVAACDTVRILQIEAAADDSASIACMGNMMGMN